MSVRIRFDGFTLCEPVPARSRCVVVSNNREPNIYYIKSKLISDNTLSIYKFMPSTWVGGRGGGGNLQEGIIIFFFYRKEKIFTLPIP